jgi:hypothetical protein
VRGEGEEEGKVESTLQVAPNSTVGQNWHCRPNPILQVAPAIVGLLGKHAEIVTIGQPGLSANYG